MRKKSKIQQYLQDKADELELNRVLKSLPIQPLENPFKKQGRPQKKKFFDQIKSSLQDSIQDALDGNFPVDSPSDFPSENQTESKTESEVPIEESKKPRHIGQFAKTPTFRFRGMNIKTK